jgi:hypothetical protein
MTHEPEDLELVIDHHQAQSIESGYPPRNLTAWRAACRKDMLTNEALHPGYIERAAAGLRARAQGKRLTYCAESRGTHAISYVWSATGTCEPPPWWNRDAAKAEHDAQPQRREPRTPANPPATTPHGFSIPEKHAKEPA